MARGNEIPVAKNTNLSSVLKGLNNGKTYSFDELNELAWGLNPSRQFGTTDKTGALFINKINNLI